MGVGELSDAFIVRLIEEAFMISGRRSRPLLLFSSAISLSYAYTQIVASY